MRRTTAAIETTSPSRSHTTRSSFDSMRATVCDASAGELGSSIASANASAQRSSRSVSPALAVRNAPGGAAGRRTTRSSKACRSRRTATFTPARSRQAWANGSLMCRAPFTPGRPAPRLEHGRDQIGEPDLGRLCEPRHQGGVIAGHQHERLRPPRPLTGDHGHLAPERVGRIHQAAQQTQRQLTLGAGGSQRRGHPIERCLRVREVPDLHRAQYRAPGGSPMCLGG